MKVIKGSFYDFKFYVLKFIPYMFLSWTFYILGLICIVNVCTLSDLKLTAIVNSIITLDQ